MVDTFKENQRQGNRKSFGQPATENVQPTVGGSAMPPNTAPNLAPMPVQPNLPIDSNIPQPTFGGNVPQNLLFQANRAQKGK